MECRKGAFQDRFFNILVNDVNYSAGSSSLRLYAIYGTTEYIAHESPFTLKSTLNQGIGRLTPWFTANYLQVNATKTPAMTLGKSLSTHTIFLFVISPSKFNQLSRFLALHYGAVLVSKLRSHFIMLFSYFML